MKRLDPEDELIETIADFDSDPEGFVDYAYPWLEPGTELETESGPRAWQREGLRDLGAHLQDPKKRFTPFLFARGTGHGVGKTGFISMVINWGMSTCVDCKVVITANTEKQLLTKTMPEITKWTRLSINSHWFKPNATSIHSTDRAHEKTWRADAISWSVNNTEAFAGLHNKKKRIILVFDEASAIDDKVWEVAEGAMTDEDTEILWIAMGNVTRNSGRFLDCFRKFAHRWNQKQIDSRDVEGTNKEQIAAWVADYGEDSDFVKVRVRGMPPAQSARQFISISDVDAAYGKHLNPAMYNFASKIIGVDPAWTGKDTFEIGMRQGLAYRILGSYPYNDDDLFMANLIAQFEDEHKADAVFIDGGYGTGIHSIGKSLKRNWRLVWFASSATNHGFFNKRAEIWGGVKNWLKEGGAIPKDPQLHADLIGPETVGRSDGRIQLESKEDMRKRGLPSPGKADALALTFAYTIKSQALTAMPGVQDSGHRSKWKPLSRKR